MLTIRLRGRLLLCVFALIGMAPSPAPPALRLASALKPPNPQSAPLRIPKDAGTQKPQQIEPGVVHSYDFHLKPDGYVHFLIDQKGVDVKAELFAEGQFLFDVDGLGQSYGPEDVPLLARRATTFRIDVSAQRPGVYLPRVAYRRPATPADEAWFEGAWAYSDGRRWTSQGKTDAEIEDRYLKAAQQWEIAGNDPGRADAFIKLGKLYRDRPAYREKALDYYLKALPLCRKVGSRQREAVVLGVLGILYQAHNHWDLAESSFRSAVPAAKDSGDWYEEGSAYTNLCKLNSQLSEFETALSYCEKAFVLWREKKEKEKEAEVLNLFGRLYVDLGQFEAGFTHHRKALALAETARSEALWAETRTHLGDAYLHSERPQLAIVQYQKALKVQRNLEDESKEAITLNNLALAYYRLENFRGAQDALERSAFLFEQQRDRQGQVAAVVNLGWVLDMLGRPQEATRMYGRALTLAREIRYPNGMASALFGMAWTERRRGNLRVAQTRVEEAIAVVEDQLDNISRKSLRTTFFAGRQNFHDFLVEVLMERHRLQPSEGLDIQAFEASERARVRSLYESLSGRLSPANLKLREVQKILDPETVLLEYFLGDSQSYLFAVTSTGFASFTLERPSVLEGLARDVHGLMKNSHKRETHEEAIRSSSELGRSLLGQVAGSLRGQRLLVVAPPALQYVSFPALPNPVAPKSPGLWPEPMIERHEIVTVPSVSVLASLRRGGSGLAGPLAMLADAVTSPRDERLQGAASGAPLSDPELDALRRLKYSGNEAAEITRHFPSGTFLALGFDATRDLVLSGKLKDYGVLHISAHGSLNRQDAGLSGLVLSRFDREGRRIDGLLRARDIESLDLSADLVVLSACSTALGKEIRGEGLVGLTQAFFSAGPPRVIVSLWDVDDHSTSELMKHFYRYLREDGMPPAKALQEAQRSVMKMRGRSAPVFWGGFVLQGDWRTSF